jgi:nicotinamide mononucleotide transporter
VTGLAYIGVLFITNSLGATLALTDSLILIGSILAQFMLDNKILENWYVWLVVNGFAIYTYFAAGLPVAGFQYIAFFLNTFYGLYVWNKSRAKSIRPNDRTSSDNWAFEPDSVLGVAR